LGVPSLSLSIGMWTHSPPPQLSAVHGSPSLQLDTNVTVACAQAALVQPVVEFRARAKYVVVAPGLTTIDTPVPAAAPPQLPVNQSAVSPTLTVTESVVDPLQIDTGVAVATVGVLGNA